MAVVFAAPPPPESEPDVVWTGTNMTWTGWDGSVWSLVDASQGTVMMPGVRGLSMPPIQHYEDTYASVPGSRWRGYTVQPREVFWPIQIYHDAGSLEWVKRDAAFWRTLHPGRTGVWEVMLPSGSARRLRMRFKDDGSQEFEVDPVLTGWQNYGITFQAEQPFWESDTIVRTFTSAPGDDFFNNTGAPAFIISPGNTLATAAVENPGDEPAWPIWIIDGPVTGFSLTVGTSTIAGNVTLSLGQQVIIDTNPRTRSAKKNDGTDVMTSLTSYGFAPLPDSVTTPLGLTLTGGNGSVTCRFTPQHHRAW